MSNKILAAMQPYLFPYIGYFQLVQAADVFVLLDDVNFFKKGFIQKNKFSNSGVPVEFILPIIKASQNKLIKELVYTNEIEKLTKTFDHIYKKSERYLEVREMLLATINVTDRSVANINCLSIKKCAAWLNQDTKFVLSSDLKIDDPENAQDRMLKICDSLGIKNFINLKGGRHLYDEKSFRKRGVSLKFLEPKSLDHNLNETKIPKFNPSILHFLACYNAEKIMEKLL